MHRSIMNRKGKKTVRRVKPWRFWISFICSFLLEDVRSHSFQIYELEDAIHRKRIVRLTFDIKGLRRRENVACRRKWNQTRWDVNFVCLVRSVQQPYKQSSFRLRQFTNYDYKACWAKRPKRSFTRRKRKKERKGKKRRRRRKKKKKDKGDEKLPSCRRWRHTDTESFSLPFKTKGIVVCINP